MEDQEGRGWRQRVQHWNRCFIGRGFMEKIIFVRRSEGREKLVSEGEPLEQGAQCAKTPGARYHGGWCRGLGLSVCALSIQPLGKYHHWFFIRNTVSTLAASSLSWTSLHCFQGLITGPWYFVPHFSAQKRQWFYFIKSNHARFQSLPWFHKAQLPAQPSPPASALICLHSLTQLQPLTRLPFCKPWKWAFIEH